MCRHHHEQFVIGTASSRSEALPLYTIITADQGHRHNASEYSFGLLQLLLLLYAAAAGFLSRQIGVSAGESHRVRAGPVLCLEVEQQEARSAPS